MQKLVLYLYYIGNKNSYVYYIVMYLFIILNIHKNNNSMQNLTFVIGIHHGR